MFEIRYPEDFFRDFPKLAPRPSTFSVKSPFDKTYNCIAYAMNDKTKPWWPTDDEPYYWPPMCPKHQATLEVFASAFATLGYETCENSNFEVGQEKVALYAKNGIVTHAARQIASGKWKSKIGNNVDTEHELSHLEGDKYGEISGFFSRQTS